MTLNSWSCCGNLPSLIIPHLSHTVLFTASRGLWGTALYMQNMSPSAVAILPDEVKGRALAFLCTYLPVLKFFCVRAPCRHAHTCSALGCQKRALGSPELALGNLTYQEFQNGTLVLCRGASALNLRATPPGSTFYVLTVLIPQRIVKVILV